MMRTTPKRSDSRLNFGQWKDVHQAYMKLSNIRFDPAVFSVFDDPAGIFVSTIPQVPQQITPTDFGIKGIDKNTVTIYGGSIWIAKAEYTVNDTPLTLSTDSTVGWEYDYAGKSLSIKDFGSTFIQDDGYIRKPLYHFTYTETTTENPPAEPVVTKSITLDRIRWYSEVFPANFGNS